MTRRLMPGLFLLSLAACGRVADLEPAPGHSLPVRPMLARTTPTAQDLLTPPTYARPDRVDELVKKSESRKADPFDLAPATGGSAPAEPAGSAPGPSDDEPASPPGPGAY